MGSRALKKLLARYLSAKKMLVKLATDLNCNFIKRYKEGYFWILVQYGPSCRLDMIQRLVGLRIDEMTSK
jgi:hypothetical protein